MRDGTGGDHSGGDQMLRHGGGGGRVGVRGEGKGVDHWGVEQMLMHGVVVWCAAAFIDVTAMVLRPACCSSARVSANLPRTSSGVAVWIRPCAQFVAPPPSRSWYRVDQAARVQFV